MAGREDGLFVAARRLTTVLPAMTLSAIIDTARIPCVAGPAGDDTAFMPVYLAFT